MENTLLLAYESGKTLQVRYCGHWEDFVPHNQLDSPNFEHSGIENWRIKPEKEEKEEVECNNCGYLMSLLPDNSIYVCTNSECTNCYEKSENELEEAAEKFRSNNPGTMHGGNNTKIINAFKAGADWQAEQMYTYDELRTIAYKVYCEAQLGYHTEGKFNKLIQEFKK
jgi:hypothetical protein